MYTVCMQGYILNPNDLQCAQFIKLDNIISVRRMSGGNRTFLVVIQTCVHLSILLPEVRFHTNYVVIDYADISNRPNVIRHDELMNIFEFLHVKKRSNETTRLLTPVIMCAYPYDLPDVVFYGSKNIFDLRSETSRNKTMKQDFNNPVNWEQIILLLPNIRCVICDKSNESLETII